MKRVRQSVILEIVQTREIQNQRQLLKALQERGISATQATISRDIRELCLVKAEGGRYAPYAPAAVSDAVGAETGARLRTIFRKSVLSVDFAQNLVILKTMPGLADGACAALDRMKPPHMVGTIAGDDTAFVAMRDADAAAALCEEIRKTLDS